MAYQHESIGVDVNIVVTKIIVVPEEAVSVYSIFPLVIRLLSIKEYAIPNLFIIASSQVVISDYA